MTTARENEILTTVVKQRIGGPAPVAAVTDLFSRGVETVIGMQQHLLTLAARQTDEWIDATKSGEPFEGLQLTALARESMETFVRSQKKFLDVLAEETAQRKAFDQFLMDFRVEERRYLRESKSHFSNKRSVIMQERLYFRNIPLSNWVEHEMPLLDGSDVELLDKSSVFSARALSEYSKNSGVPRFLPQ